jgi:hypothetical protein
MVEAVIRRGIDRGEIARDTDPELVTDELAGPIFYRYLVSRSPLHGAYVDALVDHVLKSGCVRSR